MPAENLLTQLHNVRRTGHQRWAAGCPVCKSRKGTPVAITELSDGRVLLHAFCGCDTESILGAVGLTMCDLFPPRIGHNAAPARRPFDAMQVLGALSHEIVVCDLLAFDVDGAGYLDREQRERWHTAAIRIGAAVAALDIAPAEVRTIRRAP